MPTRLLASDAALASMLQPTTNWSQHMALKDQDLRYTMVATQQQEQELLEERQATAQKAAFDQKLRSLPLEEPDKRRVKAWLDQQEKLNAKRLAEVYNGSLADFMAAEGPQWQASSLNNLENSEAYKIGVKNLEQVMQAKKAVADGKILVGRLTRNNNQEQYRTAEQDLQDYYAGKTPQFEFRGAYKDDPDAIVKHFGSQYGKSKYERQAVADGEIQNYLLTSQSSPDVAADIYYKRFAGGRGKVFYKTDPLEDFQDHQMKVEDHSMKVTDFNTGQKLKAQQYIGNDLRNKILEKKLGKLSKEEQEEGSSGGYLKNLVPHFTPETSSLAYVADEETKGKKILPHTGYDLGRFGGGARGAVRFNSMPLFDKGADALGTLLGATKTKDGWKGGKVLEGVTEKGGFNALDLSRSEHEITAIDPKIYINGRDAENGGDPMGFAKVKVKFATDADAKKAGVTEGWFDSATRVGAGNYNDETRELTIYTTVGSLYKNRALNQYLSKQAVGQKTTNEFYNPYAMDDDD